MLFIIKPNIKKSLFYIFFLLIIFGNQAYFKVIKNIVWFFITTTSLREVITSNLLSVVANGIKIK